MGQHQNIYIALIFKVINYYLDFIESIRLQSFLDEHMSLVDNIQKR